jgi:hypothetical protein
VSAFVELLELGTLWVQATVAVLSLAPASSKVTPPRAAYYAACVVRAQRSYDIPWQQIAGVIQHESQWRETIVSHTNDYGLGQHHCPSFFCQRKPGFLERLAMFEPCANIQLTAQELSHKRWRCGRKKKTCKDYVALYNPGNPTYARSIHRWEAKFLRAAQGPRPVSLALEEPPAAATGTADIK